MATNSRRMRGVSIRQVFAVLEDGWTYAYWVVGTRKIRAVDGTWPLPGSKLHYTAGHFPLRKDDTTSSLAYQPSSRLELEAHAWPAGAAGIVITVEAAGPDTVVIIDEAPSRGPATWIHNPLTDLAIKARNIETLRRLEQQAHRKR